MWYFLTGFFINVLGLTKYSTASATTSGKSFPFITRRTIAIGSMPLIRAVDVGLPTPNKYLGLDDTHCQLKLEGWLYIFLYFKLFS